MTAGAFLQTRAPRLLEKLLARVLLGVITFLIWQVAAPRLLEKLLARVRRADASCWRQMLGRPTAVRSAELHVYAPGGAVSDPQVRDRGWHSISASLYL
jgi:uncharacterized membrane protein YccC